MLEIEQGSFGDDAWDEKLFLAFYRKCPDLFLVATVRRHIAGYSITCAGRRDAELASIAVDPRDRRHGVGETMLNYTLRGTARAWRENVVAYGGNRKRTGPSIL